MSIFTRAKSAAPKQEVVEVPESEVLPALTVEDVRRAVPDTLRSVVSQSLVDKINSLAIDPEAAEVVRDNFVTYSRILQEGKFKLEDYFSAIQYATYKNMGYTNEESYQRTFPERYQNLLARGASKKDISAYVSSYHKNKLVNMILEQSQIPFWLLNQDHRQEALNTQVELMRTAQSEMVRMQAANSVLQHLEKPKENHFAININQPESSGLKAMQDQLYQLAQMQKELIADKRMKTIDVAASSLVQDKSDE